MHVLSTTTTYGNLTPLIVAAVRGDEVSLDPAKVTARDLPVLIEPSTTVTDLDPHEREWFDRTRVALVVWRIVADFIHDHEPLVATPGISLAETAEQYVCDNAEEALGCTDNLDRLLLPVLNQHSLVDDFLRMQRGDQADAFAGMSR